MTLGPKDLLKAGLTEGEMEQLVDLFVEVVDDILKDEFDPDESENEIIISRDDLKEKACKAVRGGRVGSITEDKIRLNSAIIEKLVERYQEAWDDGVEEWDDGLKFCYVDD